MDTRRSALLIVFLFSLFMLWDGWQRQHLATSAVNPATPAASTAAPGSDVPVPSAPTASAPAQPAAISTDNSASQAAMLSVQTDVVRAAISAEGGTLVQLELLKHKQSGNQPGDFRLFENAEHLYQAQSGLIGPDLPTHKTVFQLPAKTLVLQDGQDSLEVRLEAPANAAGIQVNKVLVFKRGSYQIDTRFEIRNASGQTIAPHAYFQLLRDGKPGEQDTKMLNTFTGPAVYTSTDKYQKVDFSDIEKGKAKHATKANDGWVAMVQHYFVSAFLPQGSVEREFFTRKVGDNLFTAGVVMPVGTVGAGATAQIDVPLYAGPQETAKLAAIAPGLDLVVDYGWLTIIASPLYWVLEMLHRFVGNWGWSIILLTVLIKLVFFPLSAASYRSMAKMRLITPRLTQIKERHADDKMRMQQEMMELYRKEKINPLGGCLPILVQIPVFIALYWVLLGSVEMRNAPWIGWIHDLSTKDPFFVLPIVMGVTMLIQTKLNPTPPDPIQAKVMWVLPIVFTGMFLFFPSGLVLYWVVNNLLSIAQQWQITRMIEGAKAKSA